MNPSPLTAKAWDWVLAHDEDLRSIAAKAASNAGRPDLAQDAAQEAALAVALAAEDDPSCPERAGLAIARRASQRFLAEHGSGMAVIPYRTAQRAHQAHRFQDQGAAPGDAPMSLAEAARAAGLTVRAYRRLQALGAAPGLPEADSADDASAGPLNPDLDAL